jgi:hypothetical protein
MTATYEEARDDIFAMVKEAWDPTTYLMAWPDVPDDSIPPPEDTPWARTTLRHGPGGQRGFGGTSRRFERTGSLEIQVFTPRGDGLSRAYQLGKILADVLEGGASPRGVWFRNVRLVEVDDPKREGNFSQVNLIAEFIYDEVK